MTEPQTPEPVLDLAQRRRSECVSLARATLACSSAGVVGMSSGLPPERDVPDLVDVALYVERGLHPYDRRGTEPVPVGTAKPGPTPSRDALIVDRPKGAHVFPEALRETADRLAEDGSLSAASWLHAVADALDAQAVAP